MKYHGSFTYGDTFHKENHLLNLVGYPSRKLTTKISLHARTTFQNLPSPVAFVLNLLYSGRRHLSSHSAMFLDWQTAALSAHDLSSHSAMFLDWQTAAQSVQV